MGNGACGTVHLLEEIGDGNDTDFAVKLTKIPTKKTKKQNSTEEINSSRLYFEHVVYSNQFQDVQGEFIPRLPPYKGPTAYGQAGGKKAIAALLLRRKFYNVNTRFLIHRPLSYLPLVLQC